MKTMHLYRHGIAAVLLLSSVGVASAAGAGSPFRASDDLVLTGAQEQLIWQRLDRQSRSTTAPSALAASFGTAVPASVALHALPPSVTGPIPMVKPYQYTVQGGTLLIVNPSDRSVVDVIRQQRLSGR
jgi:hypothetical protein